MSDPGLKRNRDASSPVAYLSPLNAFPGIIAEFIPRIPGIAGSTDKTLALEALKPHHEEFLQTRGLSAETLWLAEQVHGNRVAAIDEQDGAAPRLIPDVDGLLAPGDRPCLLGIHVADCCAIWLYDSATGAMALLHSGKKGTEGGISQVALDKMAALYGTNPSNVVAVLSPCIRPPLYEVNIPLMIMEQLLGAGLLPENIHDSGICTGENVHDYYSYRVEKGHTGRMLALMGRR